MSSEYLIYHIVFFILSAIALLSLTEEGKKYNLVMLVAVSIFLTLFASLNTDYPDQKGYRTFFNEVAPLNEVLVGNHNFDELYGIEWGYLFLNSVIKYFSDNDIVMFVTLASLTVWGVAYACRRLSPYPLLSMLCYYSWMYYSALGGIRHALASSIIILMVVAISANRKIIAVPIYLSAVSIHRTAIAAIVLWFSGIMIKWKLLVFFLFFITFIILVKGGIGHDLISFILPYTEGKIHGKLLLYSSHERFGQNLPLYRGTIFKQVLIFFVCLFYSGLLKKKFSSFSVVFGTYVFSLIFLVTFHDFAILGNRVSHLFIICEIILIPMLFSLIAGKDKFILLLALFACLYYQFTRLVGTIIFPYVFVFQK